jgi:hypothetical protein
MVRRVTGKCRWLATIYSFVIQNLTQHIHWQSKVKIHPNNFDSTFTVVFINLRIRSLNTLLYCLKFSFSQFINEIMACHFSRLHR